MGVQGQGQVGRGSCVLGGLPGVLWVHGRRQESGVWGPVGWDGCCAGEGWLPGAGTGGDLWVQSLWLSALPRRESWDGHGEPCGSLQTLRLSRARTPQSPACQGHCPGFPKQVSVPCSALPGLHGTGNPVPSCPFDSPACSSAPWQRPALCGWGWTDGEAPCPPSFPAHQLCPAASLSTEAMGPLAGCILV